MWAQRKMKCAVCRSILTTPRTNCRGIPRASRWRKPMGVVLKGGTELAPVGSTLEGEAAAEPPNVEGRGCRRAAKRGRARLLPSRETWEGEAPAEPPNVGGRGSCRAAKRGRARLLPSRQTWEGEAPAEPWEPAARQQFGSAGASPSQGRPDRCLAQQELRPPKGGQTGVWLSRSFALPRAARQVVWLSRSFALPRAARQVVWLSGSFALPKGRPDGCSAQRELRPPEGAARRVFRLSGSFALPKGRPDRCSAQQELRPPEGAARQPFGSAGASPSRRGDTRGKPICSCAQDFALIRIVWGRVGARRPQTSGPLCEFDCVPLLSIARGWPCEQGHMLMVKG